MCYAENGGQGGKGAQGRNALPGGGPGFCETCRQGRGWGSRGGQGGPGRLHGPPALTCHSFCIAKLAACSTLTALQSVLGVRTHAHLYRAHCQHHPDNSSVVLMALSLHWWPCAVNVVVCMLHCFLLQTPPSQVCACTFTTCQGPDVSEVEMRWRSVWQEA